MLIKMRDFLGLIWHSKHMTQDSTDAKKDNLNKMLKDGKDYCSFQRK